MKSPEKAQPWSQATDQELKQVKGVCLDIDDTLSTSGKLTPEAYAALWELKRKGYFVVPITGRPAGWCDHIARFWPVDAVVGENGAFTFYMEGRNRKCLDTPGAEGRTTPAGRDRLAGLERAILKKFPHARWASDQAYREHDLAVDICEDVKAWPSQDVDVLLDLCAKEGAHAKLSSIHVNAWFGDYDKKKGFQHWLLNSPGLPPVENWLFIGDSPNDEPMFAHFRLTVGVANLRKYLDRLKSPPRWITSAESGAGFSEMARRVCGKN